MKVLPAIKFMFNPYEKLAGARALQIALIIFSINALIMTTAGLFLSSIGAVDFGKGYASRSMTILSLLIGWFLPAVLFYIFGLIFSKSKIRAVDVAGTVGIAQITVFFYAIICAIPAVAEAFKASYDPESLTPQNIVIIIPCSILALFTLVWHYILLYKSFKISCNLKGPKLVTCYIVTIITCLFVMIPLMGYMQMEEMFSDNAAWRKSRSNDEPENVSLDVIDQKIAMAVAGGWEATVKPSPSQEIRVLINFDVDENWKLTNAEIFIPERSMKRSFKLVEASEKKYSFRIPHIRFVSDTHKDYMRLMRIINDRLEVSFYDYYGDGSMAFSEMKFTKLSPASKEIQQLRDTLPDNPEIKMPEKSAEKYNRSSTGRKPKIEFVENGFPLGFQKNENGPNKLLKVGDNVCRLTQMHALIRGEKVADGKRNLYKNYARIEIFDKSMNLQKAIGFETPDGYNTHFASFEKFDDKHIIFILHYHKNEQGRIENKVFILNIETDEVETVIEGKAFQYSSERYTHAVPAGDGNIALALNIWSSCNAPKPEREKLLIRLADKNGSVLKEFAYTQNEKYGDLLWYSSFEKLMRTGEGIAFAVTDHVYPENREGMSNEEAAEKSDKNVGIYSLDGNLREIKKIDLLKGTFVDMISFGNKKILAGTLTKREVARFKRELSLSYKIFDENLEKTFIEKTIKIPTFIGDEGYFAALDDGNFVFLEDYGLKYTVFNDAGKILKKYELPEIYGVRKGELELKSPSGMVSDKNNIYISGDNDEGMAKAQYLLRIKPLE